MSRRRGSNRTEQALGTAMDRLTPMQRRVLDLARAGFTNQQIATALGTSRNAVRFHLKNLHAELETGGDRRALESPNRGPFARAVALIGGLFSSPVVSTVAVAAISVAGFFGVRAASSWGDGPAADFAAEGPRTRLYCLGQMAANEAPGTVIEEHCFRSEAEAAAFQAELE